jgi:hypothetical protein
VGERIVLRRNHNDSTVRKGDALSLWFQPLMALAGVALGVIFILRARRTG